MNNDRGNGCLVLLVGFVVLWAILSAVLWSAGIFSDESPGGDSDDCYYSDPIPHYDECR